MKCESNAETFRVVLRPHGFDAELQWLVRHYGHTLDGLEGALLRLMRQARSSASPQTTASSDTGSVFDFAAWPDCNDGAVPLWVAEADELVAHVSRFAATGEAAAAQLRNVNAAGLMTKFLNVILARGDDPPSLLRLVDRISMCIANCCGGAGRHLSDLTIAFVPQAGGQETENDPQLTLVSSSSSLAYEVHIGFADYSNAETGARLWAGAVVLSALLRERTWVSDWLASSVARRERALPPWRVAEIGCGPALVSAVLLQEVQRRATTETMNVTGRRPSLHLCVTDVSPSAVAEASCTLTHRNRLAEESVASVCCRVLDFSDVPSDLRTDPFDVVLASDIVYDFSIAKLVPGALVELLRPSTGIAILCCEGHRDGMGTFVRDVEECYGDSLEIVAVESPSPTIRCHVFPSEVNVRCTLMVLRRR